MQPAIHSTDVNRTLEFCFLCSRRIEQFATGTGDYRLSMNTFKQKLESISSDNDERHPAPLWRLCDFGFDTTSVEVYT